MVLFHDSMTFPFPHVHNTNKDLFPGNVVALHNGSAH